MMHISMCSGRQNYWTPEKLVGEARKGSYDTIAAKVEEFITGLIIQQHYSTFSLMATTSSSKDLY